MEERNHLSTLGSGNGCWVFLTMGMPVCTTGLRLEFPRFSNGSTLKEFLLSGALGEIELAIAGIGLGGVYFGTLIGFPSLSIIPGNTKAF